MENEIITKTRKLIKSGYGNKWEQKFLDSIYLTLIDNRRISGRQNYLLQEIFKKEESEKEL